LKLASYLGADQPVVGIQSMDREERDGNEYTLEIMAGDYIKEILAYQPEGPYFLAGFSFGGFVAYEMARQLSAQGYEVGLLTILDTQAASAPRFMSSLSTGKLIAYRTKRLLRKFDYHIQNISKLPLQEIPGYLQRKRVRPSAQEAIMGDVDEEDVPEHMLSVIQANIATLQKYVPGDYRGEVVLIKSRNHGLGEYYGWNELVNGGVEVHYVPGTHRGILQDPNVELVADKLRNYIHTR
jgi:aspartate racemase